MRGNRLTLILLTIVLLAAAFVIVDRFADSSTKGRLYGWLPSSGPAATPATPTRP